MAGNTIIAVLNERWRVVDDNDLQWILEWHSGRTKDGLPKYRGRRFHRSRHALRRSIEEMCGDVHPAALAAIEALPARYGAPAVAPEETAA